MKFTKDEIANAFFEKLRLKAVELGYLPDFPTFANVNDYNNAKKAIVIGGKQIIEIFNIGSSASYGEKNTNNISIVFQDREPAKMGVGKAVEYVQDGAGYKKYTSPDLRYNLMFKITFSTTTEKYASIIEDIIYSCFGGRGYMLGVKDDATSTTEGFDYNINGYSDTSDENYIERSIHYKAINLDLTGWTEVGVVAKITQINVSLASTVMPSTPNQTTQQNVQQNISGEKLTEIDILFQ
ncbi:MAG: hypothetical protein EKK63_05005 [Acinetobacter sp.]|uniref:hypothetical protein n=1 Tax=Acinetobacter sp. TaxID=472 RepID=UPI000FBC8657|nr:hypothetical protein [Acinetobacter sp.]RUP41616.1 MAG: hypothetical protein EKK63_05005 [Acinetobacter sp.]